MKFNLVQPIQESITINSLTIQMISDLILCWGADIPAEDVEARYLIKERVNVEMNYQIISKSVIDEFYSQVEMVKDGIIAIVKGYYHTGLKEGDPDWIRGVTPTGVTELKDTLYMVVQRDYYESSTWIYTITEDDFEAIKPFLDSIVDLCIQYTAGGDYSVFVNLIESNY